MVFSTDASYLTSAVCSVSVAIIASSIDEVGSCWGGGPPTKVRVAGIDPSTERAEIN